MGNKGKKTIKIKKSKYNLYNKKKSKSRQALTLALTIVAACVLGVVGYGIGKPIMNYLESRKNPIVPGDSESSSFESSTDPVSSEPESSGDTSEPDPGPDKPLKDLKLTILEPEVVTSSASLSSALTVARENGYDTVAVTLKDEQGFLYYSSDIEGVKGTELIRGTLSAAQICDYISKAGMTPAVKINTLLDSTTPLHFGGYQFFGGGGWLDDYPDAGGKRWLSPFTEEAVNYIGELTAELSTAGFEHIICANTKFPKFHNIDADQYLSHLPIRDREARLDALWNTADAAKSGADKGGAQLWLEFIGNDLLASEKFGTDAELASRKDKLEGFCILADYTMGSAEEAYSNAAAFAISAKNAAGENTFAVLIKNGPSGAALEDIQRAFEEAEIMAFTEN